MYAHAVSRQPRAVEESRDRDVPPTAVTNGEDAGKDGAPATGQVVARFTWLGLSLDMNPPSPDETVIGNRGRLSAESHPDRSVPGPSHAPKLRLSSVAPRLTASSNAAINEASPSSLASTSRMWQSGHAAETASTSRSISSGQPPVPGAG